MLEVVWKVLSSIIGTRLNANIELYDSLHGLDAERGAVAATIEAILQMQAAHAQWKTLF
jgi:hypothetical protein